MAEEIYATFKTSMGDIVVKLFPEKAPKTVENFVGLAEGTREWTDPRSSQKVKRPLYDGTIFHRVIPDFMIQGGDPLGNGTGGPGYRFADEIGPDNKFDRPGLLAMANSGPNTNGSQFFVTEVPTPHLDRGHTILGEAVKGLDLVAKIARAGNARTRLEKVVITRGKMP
jgi:peptidyl-prolyl cis-trans isomerase A (cyclophilin A)